MKKTARTTTRALIATGLAAGLVVGTQVGPVAAAAPPAPNPNLAVSCGLDVVLAIDASYSIKSSDHTLVQMKQTMNNLVKAFADKNTRVGIVTFNIAADRAVPLTYVTSQSTAPGGVHRDAIGVNSRTGYKSAWGTNWQRALDAVRTTFQGARPGVSKLAVFVSDGAPNLKGNETAVEKPISTAWTRATAAAVPVANALKASGVHMLAVGTGKALAPHDDQYKDALMQVSGTDVVPPAALDARTVDLVMQEDLAALTAQFRTLAAQALDAPGCSYLSVQPTPRKLTYGTTGLTVRASLTGQSRTPLAGRVVRLESRVPGGSWSTLRTGKTNAAGQLTVSTSTKKTREYRGIFAGAGGQAAATSATTSVLVVPKVTLKISKHRVKRVAHVVFKGKVKPRKAVKKILLQKKIHNGWVKQAKTKPKAHGKYRFERTITSKGKWRVYAKATGTFGDGHSKKVKLKV